MEVMNAVPLGDVPLALCPQMATAQASESLLTRRLLPPQLGCDMGKVMTRSSESWEFV